MNEPLDDIFKQEKSLSIEETERRRLLITFEWIMSFSVLFWAIGLVQRFGNDWSIVIKGILLIGLFTTLVSSILSLLFAFFEYKDFDYYARFYHLWLLLMSLINGLTILLSLSSLLI
ncbi:MAG: hypothetical protein ACPG3Z_07705 [Saprospiraceae bacterium]|mgnify:FL=1